jgi:CrcB protein
MVGRRVLFKLETVLLIAIGGAVGANLRYAIGTVAPGLRGTFIANVTGSFLLGFLLYEAIYTDILAEKTRVIFGTGFLSSYTTYSTFALETVQAPPVLGVLNLVGSYAFGFVAVLVGRQVALRITGAEPTDAGGGN